MRVLPEHLQDISENKGHITLIKMVHLSDHHCLQRVDIGFLQLLEFLLQIISERNNGVLQESLRIYN